MLIRLTQLDMLIPVIICFITLFVVAIYRNWWIALFSASVLLFIAGFQPTFCDKRFWIHIASLTSFLASIYTSIEAIRIALWKDKYYHPSDDTIVSDAPPPPENLIKSLFKKITLMS